MKKSVEIIAEVAQGYEGDPTKAILLARAGVASSADSVKFHCVYADDTAVPGYKHYPFFKSLEMPQKVWREVNSILQAGGKRLILNIGGPESLQVARNTGVRSVKLHATHFFCNGLVNEAIAEFEQVYVSIGGITISEIAWFIDKHGLRPDRNVAFTYGFQSSPTPIEKTNLLKIVSLKEAFPDYSFWYEDHADAFGEDLINVSLVALGLGISHLEKHLTLDPFLKLEDSESALSIASFRNYVSTLRRCEKALGSKQFEQSDSEEDYRRRVLKVAVARRNLTSGARLSSEDLIMKRPEFFQPDAFIMTDGLVGRKIRRDVLENTPLTSEDLI